MVRHMACARLDTAAVGCLLVVLLSSGCASGLPKTGSFPDSVTGQETYSRVELVVSGIKKEEADALYRLLFDRKVVRSITFKGYDNGVATYELDMAGCECELPAFIATIPSPGLRYGGRSTQMRYTAFDNRPPDLAIVYPEADTTLVEPEVSVLLASESQDVGELRVNGVLAERVRGSFFRAPLKLKDGSSELVAVAKDRSGNEIEKRRVVKVDTAPGAREPLAKVIDGEVEPGSAVLVQGHVVPVNAQGRYRQELILKRGQKDLRIIVVTPKGEVRNVMRSVD